MYTDSITISHISSRSCNVCVVVTLSSCPQELRALWWPPPSLHPRVSPTPPSFHITEHMHAASAFYLFFLCALNFLFFIYFFVNQALFETFLSKIHCDLRSVGLLGLSFYLSYALCSYILQSLTDSYYSRTYFWWTSY